MNITRIATGLAVLAGALLAPAAALASELSAESTWSGKGEHQIVTLTEGIPGECNFINLEGVSPKNATSPKALVKPKYEECHTEILLIKEKIEVETHECEYEIFNVKGITTFTSEASLVNCPTGINLKFKSGCEVTIPEQTSKEAGSGQNLKTTKGAFESEASAGLGGFKYTATEKCKGLGIKSGSDGTYKGTALIKGQIAAAPEVTVLPAEVKFGNATKASRAVEYTNKGTTPWNAPALVYTVKEGSSSAVKTENGCSGQTLKMGEKCSVVVNYEVPAPENYKAEIKLGDEAPVSKVKATT